ncbi:hypothetical protein CCZ01_08975 [Helicobacter monodelphidis]|uniref:SAM-dependent methyltransferase n=1 Tax=Helicobacter sp. 15-1451 TaxID=2004995 RepID=UPI000DCC6889|nr:SAM-dependent methyltransferase [Helicobacter sp. 15-1451]RAX56630.1 hypothetical protein CCZ01_08975 [Helicobacter sp. 15-1451]
MQVFSSLMQEWLYGQNGYYRSLRVGKDRDFYTSVSSGELFGYTLGFFIAELFKKNQVPHSIVEIGAEQGALIADIVEYLVFYERDIALKMKFFVIEPLEEIHYIQEEYFKNRYQAWEQYSLEFPEIHILSAAQCFESPLFIANELFDAFPCDLVLDGAIGVVQDSCIQFLKPHEITDSALNQYALNVLEKAQKAGIQKGEICLNYRPFLQELLTQQSDWIFLVCDYGEFYARGDFSLRLYRNHQVFNLNDFLENLNSYFGCSDITYDVCFELLEQDFLHYGGRKDYFCRQNTALMDFGIAQVFEKITQGLNPRSKEYIRLAGMFRTLLTPSLLGEKFKVAIFSCCKHLFL